MHSSVIESIVGTWPPAIHVFRCTLFVVESVLNVFLILICSVDGYTILSTFAYTRLHNCSESCIRTDFGDCVCVAWMFMLNVCIIIYIMCCLFRMADDIRHVSCMVTICSSCGTPFVHISLWFFGRCSSAFQQDILSPPSFCDDSIKIFPFDDKWTDENRHICKPNTHTHTRAITNTYRIQILTCPYFTKCKTIQMRFDGI